MLALLGYPWIFLCPIFNVFLIYLSYFVFSPIVVYVCFLSKFKSNFKSNHCSVVLSLAQGSRIIHSEKTLL